MRFLSVSLLLTGRNFSGHAAPGIGVYLFLRIYAHPPMRQARPALRGDGQSSSLRERILRLRLAFIFRPGFPKAEKYTHSQGRKVRNIRENNQSSRLWKMD